MHQRVSAVDANCLFFFFLPALANKEYLWNRSQPPYIPWVIYGILLLVLSKVHSGHKDIAIHHCTSVSSSCFAARHQNLVFILFYISVLTQSRKQPFLVLAERPHQTAPYTCNSDFAVLLHLHDDLHSSGILRVEGNFSGFLTCFFFFLVKVFLNYNFKTEEQHY